MGGRLPSRHRQPASGQIKCRAVLAFRAVTRSDTSAAIAFAALSAWLGLLLIGWTLGGAIHLLLALALVLFPWRRLSG